jgi:outer membrane murein-binding lipoprotein Lpp
MNRSIPLRIVLGVAALGAMVSCSNQGTRTEAPEPVAEAEGAVEPTAEEQQAKQVQDQIASDAAQQNAAVTQLADARQVQAQVMDFADEMTLRLAESIDQIETRSQSIEGRTIAHRLKYTVAHGATIIASAQNPRIALVDMYVMISLQKALLERKIVPEFYGSEADRLVETFAMSEQEIKGLASKALTAEQIAEIDRLIAQWLENNPNRIYAGYVRFSEFSAARQVSTAQAQKGRAGNVLGFLFIDPLAGLDPTTREIEQARLLAERAFFYMQRMPMLISWQTELLVMDTVSEPESRQVLSNMNTLTASVEQVTKDVNELNERFPKLISEERQAIMEQLEATIDEQRQKSIDQALEGISAEREALIDQLAAQEEELRPMITDLRDTVNSATALSDSVRSTTEQFEQLAKVLRLDEPGETDPDAEPTDITDVTEALRETTRAAEELVRLSESIKGTTDPAALEERLAMIEQRLVSAEHTANRLIDRVYRKAIVVVVVLIVGLLVVVALHAWLRGRQGK